MIWRACRESSRHGWLTPENDTYASCAERNLAVVALLGVLVMVPFQHALSDVSFSGCRPGRLPSGITRVTRLIQLKEGSAPPGLPGATL